MVEVGRGLTNKVGISTTNMALALEKVIFANCLFFDLLRLAFVLPENEVEFLVPESSWAVDREADLLGGGICSLWKLFTFDSIESFKEVTIFESGHTDCKSLTS